MKTLLVIGVLVFVAGHVSASGKTRIRVTVTNSGSVNRMRTEMVGQDDGTPSKTTCDSPPVTCQTFYGTTTCSSAPVTCTTTPGRPANPGVPQQVVGRVDTTVEMDADNGYHYTIACEANWSGSHCASFQNGSSTYADIDGSTMWVYFHDSNRNGKLVNAKYRIVSQVFTSAPAPVARSAITPVVSALPVPLTEILRVSKEWTLGRRYVIKVTNAKNAVEKHAVTVLRVATFDEWLAEYGKIGAAPSPEQLAYARLPKARFYEVKLELPVSK